MQEGILSLMQMAKTCGALAYHAKARLPFLSVLIFAPLGAAAVAAFLRNENALRVWTLIFTLAAAAGATTVEAATISTHAAGVVVGKVGTATVTPQELLLALHRNSGSRRRSVPPR